MSAENACLYCVTSHGAALRVLGKDPVLADQIAINWRTAALSPRWRAMLAFASRVNERGFAATDSEIEALRAAGFGDDDVWDIAAVAAFFGFSNRMAGALDMRPNREFYAMGRAERRYAASVSAEGVSSSRRRRFAREIYVLTVPIGMPSASAISR